MPDALDPIRREDEITLRLDPHGETQELRFFGLDTDIEVTMHARSATARVASARVIAEARRYERMLSRFLPHSDISRVNTAAGEPVSVSRETYELLEAALRYCEASEGRFDITIGPATRLWDFKAGLAPTPGELHAACSHVDWRRVELLGADGAADEAVVAGISATAGKKGIVRLTDPDASLDPGGIAKGYIADRLSDALREFGIENHLICLGGNTVAAGARDAGGHPWRVTVPNPTRPDAPISLEVIDASVVTSGTYERAFEQDGRLYHHILDPRTGMPADTDLASATVVARRSIDAEGFSTTLLALGSKRAAAYAKERPEILEAFLVTRDGAYRHSSKSS